MRKSRFCPGGDVFAASSVPVKRHEIELGGRCMRDSVRAIKCIETANGQIRMTMCLKVLGNSVEIMVILLSLLNAKGLI